MRHQVFQSLALFLFCATCLAQLQGPLSGVLGSGTYTVVGNISVTTGDSLVIEPGVDLLFTGNYSFSIDGYLSAVGNETDSIKFQLNSGASRWAGIHFNNSADDFSILEYCLIFDSDSSGIRCNQSSPTISHCTISDNSGQYSGGGIYCTNFAHPIIQNCIISNNSTGGGGGGIYCDISNPYISNCVIEGNTCGGDGGGILCSESSPTVGNSNISGNWAENGGGGIGGYAFADPVLANCVISDNSSGFGGGAIYFFKMSEPQFISCAIDRNSAEGWLGGGAVYSSESDMLFYACTICDNSAVVGGGINFSQCDPTVVNCTISGNSATGDGGGIYCDAFSNTIIVNTIVQGNSGNGGINFNYSTTAAITYGDFYNNLNGNFTGNVPPGLGTIAGINANGDSCDIYSNIFLDPLFYAISGDSAYYLTANSPCIDAGDPGSPLDPDSTIADIGAYYFDQTILPPIVTDLAIMVEGSNIILNWSPFTIATSYNIYRASEPIFNISGMIPIANVTQPQYVDSLAISENHYFYIVTTIIE